MASGFVASEGIALEIGIMWPHANGEAMQRTTASARMSLERSIFLLCLHIQKKDTVVSILSCTGGQHFPGSGHATWLRGPAQSLGDPSKCARSRPMHGPACFTCCFPWLGCLNFYPSQLAISDWTVNCQTGEHRSCHRRFVRGYAWFHPSFPQARFPLGVVGGIDLC